MFNLPLTKDDFAGTNAEEFIPLGDNIINLFDETDDLATYITQAIIPDGVLAVGIHYLNGELQTVMFNTSTDVPIANTVYTVEQLTELIVESGLWSGQEIMLLSCNAGSETILSPAQELADYLQCLVWAPMNTLWMHPSGLYYVSEEALDPRSEELEPWSQKTRWGSFLPITY